MSVMITMLVISFCGWLGYAYFNPNTSSGRFLIKVNNLKQCTKSHSSIFIFSIVLELGDGDSMVPDIQPHPYTCEQHGSYAEEDP